jgi:hypothetical protein
MWDLRYEPKFGFTGFARRPVEVFLINRLPFARCFEPGANSQELQTWWPESTNSQIPEFLNP